MSLLYQNLQDWSLQGFPGSSAGKESTRNAGDPQFDSWAKKFPGEEIGYPLQYFGASLVAQIVKNPPAMWEIWVQSLGGEDSLEKGAATQLQYTGLENSWTEEPDRLKSTRLQRVQQDRATLTQDLVSWDWSKVYVFTDIIIIFSYLHIKINGKTHLKI